ncbi:NFX1-type zinc finger-containing protein 1 [Anopheles bellator]|uniref:NFX1-type zinc finger-containing protein 1 n=1 Tax=Anopheles bellator TaxID=139047 RepID=UPI0026486B60|nr:NFX1-type zinc finger-containing protein 1 [Anopheles bellator]
MSSGSKQLEDEDDDWFEKDEDDFVVAGTGKPNCSVEAGTSDRAASVADLLDNLKIFSEDYDGNYVDPTKNAGSHKAGTTFTLAQNAATKYVQTIPYTKLINIVENDALTLLADVYVQREEFVATLAKKTYGAELLLVLMRIMTKLSTLPMYETIRQFYAVLLEQDHFWEQLSKFLEQSPEVEKRKKKKKTSIVRPTVARTEMVDVLLKLLTQAKLHVALGATVTRFCRKLKQHVPDMETAHRELLAALTVSPVDSGTKDTISIYPSIEDINQEEGPPLNLKRNIVKGRFENVEHYLEVHLNLLKEDFMIPLRVGLNQYRAFVEKHGIDETFANDSIRVHYPVKLLLPSRISRRTQKEQLIVVDLDPARRGFANVSARYSRLDLSASKRLLHGSLLLFSSGPTLPDLIVAIVSHRDNTDLKNGFINVEIIRIEWGTSASNDDGCEVFNRPLLMVESEIFFEPYHQVFNALCRLRADSFPMKSYIVDVEQPAHCLPAYASQTNAHFFRYAGVEFDLKQPQSWPMETLAAAIGLNDSQYEAYRMALTNRFALIQGPPGTGKTFIGLKIVETLLANTDRQLVLICVTNHALDQFLCGVIRHTESVVRMGNQSKHPLLDAYNVKQLNEDQPIDKWLRIGYYNTKQEYLKLLEQFEELQKQQQGSNDLNKALMECMDKLQQISRRLNELSQLSSLKAIRDIRVIGMTTTFAARNRVLLELLRTPIVIIEEAAEVLEAHIVASLTKHTQHCILIGDHKQLRPTTSTYVMSARYKLDLSLFERMINNQFSVATMTVQHRMRPEIANLLRPTIYRVLEDAKPVTLYPSIMGMRHSLYFLTHTFPEAGARSEATAKSSEKVAEEGGDEKSKRNTFECRFVLALCEYILGQGPYVAEDITILTAYNGQMLQLVTERKARPALQGVRIAVIDSFQGEESRIVLLSLVRSSSHPGDTIGFLAHENRISVALSRAREGLYIVGNMSLLASCSRKWAQVERILREQTAIGQSVPLQCAEHGTVVEVKHPEELEQLNRDRRCACSLSVISP